MFLFGFALAMNFVDDFLRELPPYRARPIETDWIIDSTSSKAGLFRSNSDTLVLSNGIFERSIKLKPAVGTVSLRNLRTGEEMIRAVAPEARVGFGKHLRSVGELVGQGNRAYLTPAMIAGLQASPSGLPLKSISREPVRERLAWKRVRRSEGRPWPPAGTGLKMTYAGPGFEVDVRYELYDGLPCYAKWIEIRNTGLDTFNLNRFSAEEIRFAEVESSVDDLTDWQKPNLHLLTDYCFGGFLERGANKGIRISQDPTYETQVNYQLHTPAVLDASPHYGPSVNLKPGATLNSYHVFGLVYDSTDRERRSLTFRRVFRALAPWATESPLMLHLTDLSPGKAEAAIQQAADVGFEMVILSFGSGLNMEDTSDANIARMKQLADLAHSKGLQLGGYSLLASRNISDEVDAIDPKTGKPGSVFGRSPCLRTDWASHYFANLKAFIEKTGFDLLEHDGSYPGDLCASTKHAGHEGLEDSQWLQHQDITEFYRWCRARGIYLNVPDWYMLNGSNKTGMGYRETNWSLPREQQHIHARQNLFDGTWEKPPTTGWMFVPLVQYQGGGGAATIEPLKDHLRDYEAHLINNLAYGAQACYRGSRLYDSPETKRVVIRWVEWFKAHRAILESDVIHGHRADGRNLDWIVHVNPSLTERALACFWNPLDAELRVSVQVPLYFSGLTDRALMSVDGRKETTVQLDREYRAPLTLTVPAQGFVWVLFTEPSGSHLSRSPH